MKALLKLLTLLTVILSLTLGCHAAFLEEIIEISFRIGDDTLSVNDSVMTVETPYVVGEGVTLVPVRVITEAFGAEVFWDGEERKVTISYGDRKIDLWIGKDTCTVDGKESKLLSAPEISNSVTMVPLRFISEGFGAEVSYDEDTKAVLVVMNKGPVTENGMKFFDDGIITLSVPENYEYVNHGSQSISYRFIKSCERNFSDFDTVWGYDFVSEKIDDVESLLASDREKQKAADKDGYYVFSAVKKDSTRNVDEYSYTITYKYKQKTSLRVKKSIYNYGENCYFTISAYDNYYNTAELVYDSDGRLTNIKYDSYNLTVPQQFSKSLVSTTPLEIGGKSAPEIEIELYKKPENFDAQVFLEKEANEYVHTIKPINLNTYQDEYNIGDKTYPGYELSYINGGRVYNIVCQKENVFAVFRIESDTFDRAADIIEGFEVNADENVLAALRLPDEEEFVTVETDTMSFKLPSTFEVYSSGDGKHVLARDTKTSMVLRFFEDLGTVANDTYDIQVGSQTRPAINIYPFRIEQAISVYDMVNYKKTPLDYVRKTEETYKKSDWETKIKRNSKRVHNIEDKYVDAVYDELDCYKWIANSVEVCRKGVYIRTDTDEYTLSDSDERIKKIKGIRKSNDKETDLPDQMVHGFEFTYTNMFNEKEVNELVERIIGSVTVK